MAVRALMAALLAASAIASPALAQRERAEGGLGGEPEMRRNREGSGDEGQQAEWRVRQVAPPVEQAVEAQPQPVAQPMPEPVSRQVAQAMPEVRSPAIMRESPRSRSEWSERSAGSEPDLRRERAQTQAQPQPEPPVFAQSGSTRNADGGWQGRRGPGGGWGQSPPAPSAAPPAPSATPSAPNVGVWRGDGNNGWRGSGGRTVPPPVVSRPGSPISGSVQRWGDRDRDGVPDRRDWDRNNDGRVDGRWDHNRDGNVDRRYDWDRDGRRDGWYRQGRPGYGWNSGRWNQDRWNRNGWDQTPGWDRGWRNDQRYDWRRYRYQNRDRYRLPRYSAPYGYGSHDGYGYGYQRFGIGIYLDSLFFSSRYWIDQPYDYRLPSARYPYRWVRYYDDVLLVDTRSGYVVDVIYDFFW